MADQPDNNKEAAGAEEDHFLSRRQFFIKLGGGSLAIAGAGATVFAVQYLSPNVLYEPSPIVSAGRPEHFPANSVTLDPRFAIYIVHGPKGFYAMSSICTHLGCMTVWKQDSGVIACPCHGSTFRQDGEVIGGPAPRPLLWLKTWLGSNGEIMVNRSTIIAAESEYIQA
ncbi:MAG: ubiquinol-cytochrome c reductase iron-sulfur subunit [Candidatus Acidiferrales bacterium]